MGKNLSRYITGIDDYLRSRQIQPKNVFEIEQEILDLQNVLVDIAKKASPIPRNKKKNEK